MTIKHTPAPWKVCGKLESGTVPITDYDNAIIFNTKFAKPQDLKLIAAAPELLEALSDIIAWHDGSKTYCNWIKAREALAKATGEKYDS